MDDAGKPLLPKDFVEERRGRTTVLARCDLAESLLSAGLEDPDAFLARHPPERVYRGRGRASRVTLSRDDGSTLTVVLRTYRHGGLLGALGGGLFVFGDRARDEIAALVAAAEAEVAVVRPLAAVRQMGGGLFYRAHLVTEFAPGARDLVAWLEARRAGEAIPDPARVLEGVGRDLRRLHDAGIDVPDLHVKNVLVRAEEPSRPILLDFDRARVRRLPVATSRRLRDLFRFDRSLEKLGRRGPKVARRERARFFRGYLGDDAAPLGDRRAACRRYRFHLTCHRLNWALRGR